MITQSDIVAAVRGRWLGGSVLSALVPGGVWFGFVPPAAAVPYAALAVESEDARYLSDGRYLQTHTVQAAVWSDGPAEVDAGVIAAAMAARLNNAEASLTLTGGRVVRVKPAAPRLEIEDDLRAGADVCVTRAAWRVTVEGQG